MNTVYRKTPKGIGEIETRALRLVPRLRSALILVDGKKSDDELAPLIAGDAAATLAGLLADGFIEVLATLAERPASRVAENRSAAAAPSRREPASGATTFETVRRDAVRQLNDLLGPVAEELAIRIERSKSMPELQPLLVQGAQTLRNLRGAAVAEAFAARFITA
jgi:hypothetical protein